MTHKSENILRGLDYSTLTKTDKLIISAMEHTPMSDRIKKQLDKLKAKK